MTPRSLFGAVERTLTAVVLVVSGGYLLIYLYRWEWNRAIISGIFFVSAEVALSTSIIMRRIGALERAEPTGAAPDALVLERLRSTPVERPNPFGWLAPRADRTSVFVPVLLGAGVVLSALAYIVERIAEATAVPALDRRLAHRLALLAPPPVGLLGQPPVAQPPARRRRTTVSAFTLLVAAASIGVLAWLAIGALIDATQTRPERGARPASTTISLEVLERHQTIDELRAAEALWVSCRPSIGRGLPTEGEVIDLGNNLVELVLRPGLGHLATRRLTGCLSDVKLDLVRADVLDVEHTPPAAT